MDILDLLKSDGSIIINKKLSHKIGVLENIVLSELISQYKYFQNKGQLDNEGYFYCTIKKLKKNTALSRDEQDRAINKLLNLNLIDKDVRGLPAKRHFKVNEHNILKLFINKDTLSDNPRHVQVEDFPQTALSKNRKQVRGISTNINNNNYNLEEEEEKKISKKVCSSFEQIFQRKMTPFENKQLLVTNCNCNLIIKALELTGLNSKNCSIGYTIALLDDWTNKDLKNVQEVEVMLKKYKQKKYKSKKNKINDNANYINPIMGMSDVERQEYLKKQGYK